MKCFRSSTLIAAIFFLTERKCNALKVDGCWPMEKIQNDDVQKNWSVPCALNRASEKDVSCSLSVSIDKGVRNRKCLRCIWKETEEGMCRFFKATDALECCCKTRNCNYELFKDALPGWGKKNWINNQKKMKQKTNYNHTYCVDADMSFMKWMDTARPVKCPTTNSANDSVVGCELRFITKNKDVLQLNMGCNRKCASNSPAGCDIATSANGIETLCCCNGSLCNSKLYRDNVFKTIINSREMEETKYFQMEAEAYTYAPSKFWRHKDDYRWNGIKNILDAFMLVGSSLYALVIIYLYRLFRPVNMENRPPPLMSLEEISQKQE